MTATMTIDRTDERLLAAFVFWNIRGYVELTETQFAVALNAEPAMNVTAEAAARNAMEHGLIEKVGDHSYQQTQAFLDTTFEFEALGETLFRKYRDDFGLV